MLPVVSDARRQLEVEWCTWSGSWGEFVAAVRARGRRDELAVLEVVRPEFRPVPPVEQAARVESWQQNLLMEHLGRMDELSRAAMKMTKSGYEMPDNSVRFQATKYLIDRSLGFLEERRAKRTPAVGEAHQDILERREELRQILAARGVDADFEVRGEGGADDE